MSMDGRCVREEWKWGRTNQITLMEPYTEKTLCVWRREGQSAVLSVCITVKLTEEKP